MKFATWNINECIGFSSDLDHHKTIDNINEENIQEVIDKINEYDFDIICFQEYPVYIDKNISLTKKIINETKLKYYEEIDTYDSCLFKGGRTGVAIFSKYKIIDSYLTIFNNPHITKVNSKGIIYKSFDKGLIKVVINIDEVLYTVITGHAITFTIFDKTEFDYPESYKPLEELIKFYKDDNLIVLGDFNTEKLYDIIPSIKDIVRDTLNGPTTKDFFEISGEVHIDYIMINKNIKCLKTYKIDNYSDHYIICSELIKKDF